VLWPKTRVLSVAILDHGTRPAIALPLHRFPRVVGAHERPKRADGGDDNADYGAGVETRVAATAAAVVAGG
jgi:hypothetical protein